MLSLLTSNLPVKRALFAAFIVSAALLAGAHAFEHFGGLAPCALCLDQREVHWAALGVTIVSYVLFKITSSSRILIAGVAIAALVYMYSAGLSLYHAGVEWKWWAGPAGCSAANVTIVDNPADLLRDLASGETGPSCSDAAWRMFGISMAGYNFLISLAMAGVLLTSFITSLLQKRQSAFAQCAANP